MTMEDKRQEYINYKVFKEDYESWQKSLEFLYEED